MVAANLFLCFGALILYEAALLHIVDFGFTPWGFA
jgi:hypothetical protein